ncbi:MAG: hypothetical protein Q7S73_00575 [bacterium]|nr:hypothetical protein [bacterium]
MKQEFITIKDSFEMTEREKGVYKNKMVRDIRRYKLVKTGRPIPLKRIIAIVDLMMKSMEETRQEFAQT